MDEFSIWALLKEATLPVKLVILILILMSIWSWTIAINKWMSIKIAKRRFNSFDKVFWSGEPLNDVFERMPEKTLGGAEKIFSAGMSEWRGSQDGNGAMIAGVQSRIERSMDVALNKEAERLQSQLGVLASVGSVAPFIGLFGTVWGIMNAFIEIAAQQNTNLAVVAPGIAEALIATAMGLFAAIPAVVAYNRYSSSVDTITGSYVTFTDEFSSILHRQVHSE